MPGCPTPTPGGMSPGGNTLFCPPGVTKPDGSLAAVAAARSAAAGPLSENASTYFDRPFCARMLNGTAAAAAPGDGTVPIPPGGAAVCAVPAAPVPDGIGDAPSVVGGGGGGPASASPSLPGSTQRPNFSS